MPDGPGGVRDDPVDSGRVGFGGSHDSDAAGIDGPRSNALLIYDADCGFCQRSLALGRRLLPWTPPAVGFQQVDVSRYGLTEAQARQSIQLCRDDRPIRHGAAAIAAILQAQPSRPWRIAGHLLAAPPVSWIAAGCYRVISRYRHRLPGSTCAARASH